MTIISIPLAEEQQAQLQALADHVGLSAEEYLQRRVKALLARPDPAFDEAAAHVMQKNAELYRRLT